MNIVPVPDRIEEFLSFLIARMAEDALNGYVRHSVALAQGIPIKIEQHSLIDFYLGGIFFLKFGLR